MIAVGTKTHDRVADIHGAGDQAGVLLEDK